MVNLLIEFGLRLDQRLPRDFHQQNALIIADSNEFVLCARILDVEVVRPILPVVDSNLYTALYPIAYRETEVWTPVDTPCGSRVGFDAIQGTGIYRYETGGGKVQPFA